MNLQTSTDLQFQFRDYGFVSLMSFWVYDCFLTLAQEVSLIHGPPWYKGSVLYVMARYFPAFLLCVCIYMNYLQNELFVTCNSLHSVWYGAAALCISSAEGIFVLRTYALWGNKKSIMGLMLSTVLCLAILDVVIMTQISSQLDLQLWVAGWGCYSPSQSKITAAPWSLLIAFELEIIVLTMIRVYWAYRERRCRLLDFFCNTTFFTSELG
ncbi:uncharacterized protein EDB91DRAFT_554006 [Suillus paluster]|uniref:uncharacterized protein n=1 Tax=Suillus paluster TaxID=48578 RepID=UPI001B87AFA9|nr:uncharacterized protein EDB91DRAFT_554006 [Suillus paluster]KAG1735583.1 hypothetical protein EDB91DRAFT_554006 [Suillus paluster]